jgi:hypothetical protein
VDCTYNRRAHCYWESGDICDRQAHRTFTKRLAKAAPAALIPLGKLFSKAIEFGASLFDIPLASYLVVGDIAAAIVGLAVAGYELYRHWEAVKRLFSRSIEWAHSAVINLMKWLADKTRNATARTANSIATITATLPSALQSLTDASPAMRGLNSARAVERAGARARSAPMLGAMRRATATVAFAAPLILAGAPAGTLATPLISTGDTARVAAPQSAPFMTQSAIVIDYSPNVVIHCGDAADAATLKRRVMEILERHGRELHQVLQREIVRQQRRDFQPRYSNEQG